MGTSKKIKKLTHCMILLGLCGIFLGSKVFAAKVGEYDGALSSLAMLLYTLESLFSWLWIVLASIVGKLMTNSFLYGEAFHFDIFLWKVWQLSRNIANFALGFLFLYEILHYLIAPTDKKTPMAMIREMLIAGVGIQMSWFLIMVVVDISTVIFVRVSSFPSQLIAADTMFSNAMSVVTEQCSQNARSEPSPYGNVICKAEKNLTKFSTDPGHQTKQVLESLSSMITIEGKPAGTEQPKENLFDNLFPKPDSLAGPLMFLGFEIFKSAQISDYYAANGTTKIDTQLKQIIQILLHSGMMIMYTFSLLVLFVVLFARGVYLWIFIAISPIAVLIRFMGKHNKALSAPTDDVFWDIEKAIKLIFYPVYYALFVGLMMIVLVVINRTFKFNLPSSKSAPLLINQSANSTTMNVENNLLSITMKDTAIGIYDLLLGVIGLALMRMLIKTAIQQQTGIKAIDTFTKDVAAMAQSAIETTPIIPVGSTSVGIGVLTRDDNVLEKKYQEKIQPLVEREREQINSINALFGLEQEGLPLNVEDKRSLKTIVDQGQSAAPAVTLNKYKDQLASLRKKNKEILFSDIEDTLFPLFEAKYMQTWKDVYKLQGSLDLSAAKDAKEKRTVIMAFLDQNANFKNLYENFFGVKDKIPRNASDLENNSSLYKLPAIK